MTNTQNCPTDLLVEIGSENDETDKGSCENLEQSVPAEVTTDPLKCEKIDSEQAKVKSSKTTSNKLCGYLDKIAQGGLIKGSKTRWFDFDVKSCVLSYYRSPKDVAGSPLGKIAISNCAFTCTAQGLLENSFQITSDTRTHILQACDQKTMLWWLQELQTERRIYNVTQQRTKQPIQQTFNENLFDKERDPTSSIGLLDMSQQHINIQETSRDSLSIIPVLPRIETPPETVGVESAALQKSRPVSGMGLSEIGNKMSQIGEGIAKRRIKPVRPAPPISASLSRSRKGPSQTGHSDIQLEKANDTEKKSLLHSSKGPLSRTTTGFGHMLDKIQNSVKAGGNKLFHADLKQINEINETLVLVREEMELMKTSLESKEETIQLLKKELDKYSVIPTGNIAEESAEAKTRSESSENHHMRSKINALKLSLEHLREELDKTKLDLKQQQEKVSLFEEMLQVKDGIVIQLTTELHELDTTYKEAVCDLEKLKLEKGEEFILLTPMQGEETATPVGEDREEYKKMKDAVEAYNLQNKFLNNEILELTHLRHVDEGKIDQLHDKTLLQEAKHCQLQSKYLILLSDANRFRSHTVSYNDDEEPCTSKKKEEVREQSVVNQLIQEAVKEGEEQDRDTTLRPSKYDKYGFTQVVDDGDESTLLVTASRLEQRASYILNSIHVHDASIAQKWKNYVTQDKEWQRNAELKSLIRLGIPHELRHRVWKFLVNIRTRELRKQYDSDGKYYANLCQSHVAPLHAKQIDLDLLRTLPTNKNFSDLDCEGTNRLKKILRAYSVHNPSIGYCQGLNRVAAVALLYLNEQDAFWGLVAIVDSIMPANYYSSTLEASQADQRVFRDLLAEKMPRLHRHLESLSIDLSLITFNWFLCIYCDNVPPETMFRIWDVFLNESSKVLFRYGLAFFKHIEEDLLALTDYSTVFNLLRRMVHRMYDARALSLIAFQGMNPFPMKKIQRLRVVHLEKVNSELVQLDIMRRDFASKRNKTCNSDIYSDDEDSDSGDLNIAV